MGGSRFARSVKLKILKCGGTLSKAHSVCVPNKVTQLKEFPLRLDEVGLIYYAKPGRNGDAKHKVR